MPEALIKVTLNTRNFLKQVGLAEKKVKRMSANALNNLAFEIKKKDLPLGMDKHIDRPTPFTRRGGRVLKSKAYVDPQIAWVYIAEKQEKYLTAIVKGGKRTDRLPVPGWEVYKNKYGNLPRTATKGKKVFYTRNKRGIGMHVKRVGRKGKKRLQIVGMWLKARYYSITFPLFKVVQKAAQKKYNREYRRSFNKFFRK